MVGSKAGADVTREAGLSGLQRWRDQCYASMLSISIEDRPPLCPQLATIAHQMLMLWETALQQHEASVQACSA